MVYALKIPKESTGCILCPGDNCNPGTGIGHSFCLSDSWDRIGLNHCLI
jgi:hypothetical protein